MPKARGRTAAGQIEHYLRGEGIGQQFTVEGLADMFKTSEGNVTRVLRELRMNGWRIDQEGYSMRNHKKPHYIAKPPGEKA